MASSNFTFIIESPASTSVTVTPVAGLVAPVAAGTVLATIAVAPAGWLGAVAVSGANAADISVAGAAPNYTLIAAVQMAAGSYAATVTVTP